MGLNRRERGGGEKGSSICARSYKSSKGTNLTVVEGMRQFIMYILYVVQPVRRGRSVWGGKFPTHL